MGIRRILVGLHIPPRGVLGIIQFARIDQRLNFHQSRIGCLPAEEREG